MKRLRWFLVGLVAVNAALGLGLALTARDDAPAGATVVPFEMLPSNHMVVKATLNGKGPFRFIFDLGAPVTLLNNKAGEASGAIKADAPRSFLFNVRGE